MKNNIRLIDLREFRLKHNSPTNIKNILLRCLDIINFFDEEYLWKNRNPQEGNQEHYLSEKLKQEKRIESQPYIQNALLAYQPQI